jgi:hypothetical protein
MKKQILSEEFKRMQKLAGIQSLNEEKIPTTPQELIKNLPTELKDLFFKQWGAKQNPKWHPEGNSLKHIIIVIKRAYHHYPNDPNMIMAALFHDLGKMDTYAINPKTGEPTAYGHEEESVQYIDKFKSWIESFDGTDVEEIKYLVKNHMKIKPSTWDQMKDAKKEPIEKHQSFSKLKNFTDKLDGGGINLQENENSKEKIYDFLYSNEIMQDTGVTSFTTCDENDWEKVKNYINGKGINGTTGKQSFLANNEDVTEEEFDKYYDEWLDYIEDQRADESRNQQDLNFNRY